MTPPSTLTTLIDAAGQAVDDAPRPRLVGEAAPSPAGPLSADEPAGDHRTPPSFALPPSLQTLRFLRRPLPFMFRARRELGETFALQVVARHEPIVLVSHPDHVRSLFTAPVDLVPSMAAESPLRPVLGAGSVLTANGPRHIRQRRLLLPPFHGEAIARYTQAIERVVDLELQTWTAGGTFATAPRMQAVTLGVIMAGIFGVEGEPAPGTPERGLRDATRRVLALSERPAWQAVELMNAGLAEPRGLLKLAMDHLDRHYLATIAARRAAPHAAGQDVLSLLLDATDEDGRSLSDREVRDELLTLVLAGHETTANSLAWAFERLTRSPQAYADLRDAVRGGTDAEATAVVDATIHEAMRVRPVIPLIGRRVQAPWQLGEYTVPAKSIVSVAIPLLHHREDVYPDPFAFRPERFLGVKPGTYTWVPFGGGTRRCLGAALAMAEQRIVLRAVAARVDLAAPQPRPEREQHRNVTMIPAAGGRVTVVRRVG